MVNVYPIFTIRFDVLALDHIINLFCNDQLVDGWF